MVTRRAQAAFELFLYLAYRFLREGHQPVVPAHEELCAVCGLDPNLSQSRSAMSRLLRSLRATYQVIEYTPIQRRRPEIRLALPRPGADIRNPRHYVYFEGWDVNRRALFQPLGNRAFAAEYMFFVAQYESALARIKHQRPYWFFPLERISATYHVSQRFASVGLRALVDLGIMRVVPGQYGRHSRQGEFGAANRYYFEGLGEPARRDLLLRELRLRYPKEFDAAFSFCHALHNGATAKNITGLSELISIHGTERVRTAVEQVSGTSPRSLRRRLGYVRWLLAQD